MLLFVQIFIYISIFLMYNYNVTNIFLIMNFTYSQIMLNFKKLNFQFPFTSLFCKKNNFLLLSKVFPKAPNIHLCTKK
jgi:hypothetical protein